MTVYDNTKNTGGQKMPKELKALVHISVWVLFIYACVMLITTIVQSARGDIGAELTMVGGGIAMVSFFLTTIAAKIRKNLE
jgi:hypothetical protein